MIATMCNEVGLILSMKRVNLDNFLHYLKKKLGTIGSERFLASLMVDTIHSVRLAVACGWC